jgi:hypothetical protein
MARSAAGSHPELTGDHVTSFFGWFAEKCACHAGRMELPIIEFLAEIAVARAGVRGRRRWAAFALGCVQPHPP